VATAWRRCRRQSISVAGRFSSFLDGRLFAQTSLTAAPRLDTTCFCQTRSSAQTQRITGDGSRRVVVGPCPSSWRSQSVDERRERLQRDGFVEGRGAAFQITVTSGGRSSTVTDTSSSVGAAYGRQLEPKRLVNACVHPDTTTVC